VATVKHRVATVKPLRVKSPEEVACSNAISY
jgi:hypothetical protein